MKTWIVTIAGWSEREFTTEIIASAPRRALKDALVEYEDYLTERGLGDPENLDIHIEEGEE